MITRKHSALVTVGMMVSAAGVLVATANEQKVEVGALPAVVRNTAEAVSKGGTITEAELEEEKGQQVYSVEVKTGAGEELEVEIAPDGKLIKVEKEGDESEDDDDENEGKEEKIETSQAPAGVQAAIGKYLKDGAQLKALAKEQEGGATVYEAEYKVADVEHSLKLAANGAVLEQENEVTTGSLPSEVSQALKKRFPNAQVSEAEEVTVHFYELEIVEGGKKREVKISAAGQIMGGKEDDEDDDDDKD